MKRAFRPAGFMLTNLLALTILLQPRALAAPLPARDWKPILERLDSISVVPLPELKFHPDDGAAWEAPDADTSDWQAYRPGQEWNTGSVWFRVAIEVPASLGGYDIRGATLRLQMRFGGENNPLVFVYVNGTEVSRGESLETAVVVSQSVPGAHLVLAIKAQVLPGRMLLRRIRVEAEPVAGRPDPRRLIEECQSADALLQTVPQNPAIVAAQSETVDRVDEALGAIEWSALGRGDQNGFDHSLETARQKLDPLRGWLRTFTVHAVGNSHIDMAWLWPWTETVEVVRNTFTSVLNLMQEFPDLKFAMSTARAYSWMEEKYPVLFDEIRRRVGEGRWEPVGGMWVEPDLNMPDGESLVRQLLIGKRYFREKLGVDTRVGWNPDSFGYNWQLPQIYKKSGMDYFVTQKLTWNDTTRFPYSLFWWESPDGSRVLTYFPHDYVNSMDPVKIARDFADFETRAGYPGLMHLFGIGDHGGGPTREMLRDARRWQAQDAIFPRIEMGTAQSYLDRLAESAGSLKIPVWKDELYFEYHRGVFTSQVETKKNNRRNEVLLLEAEKFAALAFLSGRPYPQADFEEAWKKVLFNQFHDVLSGSGIHPVYVDATRDHAEVHRAGNEILSGALADIATQARTEGVGVPVVVFNPLSWPRTGVVETEAQFPQPVREVEVRAPSGQQLLAEIVSGEPKLNRVRVRFIAEDVPAMGYAVFHLVPMARAHKLDSPLSARATTLENEFVRVQVDSRSGCMTSLFDKVHKLELVAPGSCGNELQAFVDKPKDWDAWNIDADYVDHQLAVPAPVDVRLVASSPAEALLRVTRKFQNSTLTQDIFLHPHIPGVDVRFSADWHERHVLLKVAFPVAVASDVATFEIPYGSIERPTTRRTPAEKAKFEVPALRWGDLSDAKQGMSLLNDCKYGYDALGNVLRLSLLRAPTWPDPEADQGFHEATYALLPHAGGWREAETVRRGYELNTPLVAVLATAHAGTLPASNSFLDLSPANLVLTAVKKAEDDNSLIFRFYEFEGKQTEARLLLPPGATEAVEANLMESPQRDLPIQNGQVVIPTGPYEIKCVKVRFFSVASSSQLPAHPN